MNVAERKAYLKALLYIATVDESVDRSEITYLKDIAATYGLSGEDLNELMDTVLLRTESLDSILTAITERNTKLTLLYELVVLSYVDGHYTDTEKIGIKTISSILQVEEEKLIEIENIVPSVISIQSKLQAILNA